MRGADDLKAFALSFALGLAAMRALHPHHSDMRKAPPPTRELDRQSDWLEESPGARRAYANLPRKTDHREIAPVSVRGGARCFHLLPFEPAGMHPFS
jgi:hypothetical protein